MLARRQGIGVTLAILATTGLRGTTIQYCCKPLDDEEDVVKSPLLIADTTTEIKRLTVTQAVMHLDLSEAPAMMFQNMANDSMNMVYRRPDGNIAWIDSGTR